MGMHDTRNARAQGVLHKDLGNQDYNNETSLTHIQGSYQNQE